MSLLGCLVITEGYIVAYLATNLQKESYTIRLLRFRSNDGVWCVAYVESPLVGTSVKYLKGGRGRWQLLTNEMPINNEIIKFQWGIDGVRYYCECTRYVKL